MNDDMIFAASAGLRREFAELVASLDAAQLDTPSLCGGWSVRVVAAHLVSVVSTPGTKFLGALVRSGFRPHVTNDRIAREVAARPVPDLVATLKASADKRYSPPVIGPRGPLTDLLVHEADIRLPLGMSYEPKLEHVEIALDFLSGRAPGFVPRGLLAGVQLAPTDLDRTWGSGAAVTGRAADLMLAACGRPVVLPELSGPGVALLRSRLSG